MYRTNTLTTYGVDKLLNRAHTKAICISSTIKNDTPAIIHNM